MRVIIGPYPNSIQLYKWFDKWIEYNHNQPCWEIDDSDYTWVDKLIEKGVDSIQSVLNATINKINRPRKVKVRIDKYDTWNMDHTLAYIILPMLKQLKETNHGSSHVDDEDVPEELRSTSAPPKKNKWETDEFHHKRWEWAMNQMIWAFEQILDEDEGRDNYYDNDKLDMGKYTEYNAKVQKALILFGKYFRSLWD